MNNFSKKVELMAPAGNEISLQAALDAGADAVYFGAGPLNMRSSAKNFSIEQLDEITERIHKAGAKAYLTLNTIIYQNELDLLEKTVILAKEAKIDAVICWDFAAIELLQKYGLEPFISTQMSVSNSAAMAFLFKHFGIKRFVLARECTLEDIRLIREDLKTRLREAAEQISIEVFIHGAMCVATSGRCFMSQFQFGTSANRGECRQPCRREYEIRDLRDGKEFVIGNNYVMSPKDLCTMPFLDKIIEAGANSLKIEGRGRSPEYVHTTVSCYRKFLDVYCNENNRPDEQELQELKDSLVQELNTVFNRGFSPGYYMGRDIADFAGGNGSKSSHRKEHVGKVTNFFKKHSVAEIKLEAGSMKEGEVLMFQGPKTGVKNHTILSIEENYQKIESVAAPAIVGVKLEGEVRVNDAVYRIVKAETPDS